MDSARYTNPAVYQSDINSIVENILVIRKDDSTADIRNIESEIDHLVYQLYELTEEEIAIIEQG